MVLNFEEAVEFLRGVPLPCWLFFSFIVFGTHVGHVSGVQDFSIYRMQHFDLHGTHHGTCVPQRPWRSYDKSKGIYLLHTSMRVVRSVLSPHRVAERGDQYGGEGGGGH